MAQPYIGEIRQFAGNFGPVDWLLCQGQLLAISEYDTLFTLIGTTYGGDGQETFALPDLQGRVPIHMGTGSTGTYQIGESGGTESVTLTASQIPVHSHAPSAGVSGGADTPSNNIWAESGNGKPYSTTPNATMKTGNIVAVGGSQPHENTIPTMAINYIISMFGTFPSQGSGTVTNGAFMSQITIFSFGFAPAGWAMCNGQGLAINQNQALFSLLGTTYGGNGTTTFNLPDLRGRVPMHTGNSVTLGQKAGEASHTLTIIETPAHTHQVKASAGTPDASAPTGNSWASHTGLTPYASYGGTMVAMSAASTTNAGGGQPHNNMAPYLALNYCIALQGIYPSPN